MAFYDELKAGLEEAVEIARGNKKPERFSTITVEIDKTKPTYPNDSCSYTTDFLDDEMK